MRTFHFSIGANSAFFLSYNSFKFTLTPQKYRKWMSTYECHIFLSQQVLLYDFDHPMNHLTQMMKEVSKRRPITFADISFPISQEIQSKIKSKNVSLRRKIKKIIQVKNKCGGKETSVAEHIAAGKTQGEEPRSDEEEINYLEAFVQKEKAVNQDENGVWLARERQQLKEEDTSIQIYYLIAKRKHIFKVEQVQRRFKKPHILVRKNSLKECDCCGSIGRHQCQHLFCEDLCRKIRRRTRKKLTKRLPSNEKKLIQCNELDKAEDLCHNIEPSPLPQPIDTNIPHIPDNQQDQKSQSSSSSLEIDQDMVFLSSQSSYG